MRSMIRVFRKSSVFLFPAGLSFASIMLLIASSVIGVADVRYAGRQVGYTSAPNWFLSPVLLFPIAGALAILIIRWVDRALTEMVRRKMLFDTTKSTTTKADSVGRRWNFLLGLALAAWIVLTLGGFAASIKEWRDVSYSPLTRYATEKDLENAEDEKRKSQEEQKKRQTGSQEPGQTLQDAPIDTSYRFERDWSIASFFKPEVDRTTNYLFSLAAFLVQGLMLSCLSLFLVVCVAFGTLIFQLSGPERITIVPDLHSSDKRKGFEIFEDLGGLIILASLCLFFAFFLTLLQNLYLHDSDAMSLPQMLYEPIRVGIHDKDFSAWKTLLTPKIPSDYSSSHAQVGGILVIFLVVVLIPGLLLHYAARRAHDNLKRLADHPACLKIFGRGSAELKKIAKTMEIWPYRYFTLNMLLAAACVLAALLFWPLIAAYFYGIVLAAVVPWALTKFRSKVAPPEEGSPDTSETAAGEEEPQDPEVKAAASGPRNGRKRQDGR